MKKILIILLICSSCSKSKNYPSTNSNIFIADVESVLNKKVPELQNEYNVPAVAVGLIENGEIRYIKVYGEHQKGRKAPKNSIFNVGSITKTIVSTATLKLVDNGDWNLDEPLHNYWTDPDLKDNPLALKLTTRHVLSHTTGFMNWRRMHPSNKLTFDFEPGTKFQYSGEGYEYLAAALQKKFNLNLERLVDSLVFQPMDMKDGHLRWLKGKDTLRFAKWYDTKGKEHDEYYKTHWISAADDLLVTVQDLANFGINVMDEKYISKELFQEMTSKQIKIHNNADQGLGWTVVKNLSNGEYLINHDGSDVGVATSMILFPKSKSGIIIFTNGDNGRIICNKIIKESLLIGEETANRIYWTGKVPEVKDISQKLIDAYSGDYMSSYQRKISFNKKGKTLVVDGSGFPQLMLYPESENTFFPKEYDLKFVFETDGYGKVMSFSVFSDGKELFRGDRMTINN